MGYFGLAIPPVTIPVTTSRTPAMQEGRIIDSFLIEGTETRFRYPCWRDLDAFIDVHRTLTREKVMCRRLELNADSGGRELSQALVGLKQHRSSTLLVEQEGVLLGEGFTQKSGHDYCTIGLALIARAQGLGIGARLMGALEKESRRIGARRLYLTVWSANVSAVHVYRKVGYVESGRRPHWVLMDSGETCDLIDMVKIIE